MAGEARNPKLAYTVQEAMAAIGLGRTRFYKEVKLGRLKTVKAGRRTLVPAAALEDWLRILQSATEAA